MKVNKLDHICIAVKDLEQARKAWEPVLGKSEPDDPYVDESEKIRVARYWIGEIGFELMESTTPDGPVAKWIEKHGEGVMVLSLMGIIIIFGVARQAGPRLTRALVGLSALALLGFGIYQIWLAAGALRR